MRIPEPLPQSTKYNIEAYLYDRMERDKLLRMERKLTPAQRRANEISRRSARRGTNA